MNLWLVAAAAVIVLLAIAHSYLGERILIGPLQRRDDLPPMMGDTTLSKRTLRFAWHVTSVLALGLAGLLLLLARYEQDTLTAARIIAATLALSGLLSLVIARGRHPAWILFFAAALLAWLGVT